jgi:serine O-acetyltransferase
MIVGKSILCDYTEKELLNLLFRRMENFFILSHEEKTEIEMAHQVVLDKLEVCFQGIDNKYFKKNGAIFFSPNHSGQYLIYIYIYSHIFANTLPNNNDLKDKFYYLNKILHSVDIYSEIVLPPVFFFEHPLGLVLGRATYGNNFFAMQGCTVGGNKGMYPIIGENVKMYSNSKIIGNSIIENNVWISANTYIKDFNIPSNSIVFGISPNLIIKRLK